MSVARSLSALITAALLVGCGSDDATSQSAAAPANPSPATSSAAPAKPAPDMARGVVSGKPAAGVDLWYEIESRPEPGQPVDVEVLLTASVGVDTLEATISGMEGLRVLSPAEPTFSATALAAGDELRQTITLVPETAGVYYASILVKTDGDTGLQARTFAIPLVVGAVAAAAEKPAETDAGGERIRSMPAQENGA